MHFVNGLVGGLLVGFIFNGLMSSNSKSSERSVMTVSLVEGRELVDGREEAISEAVVPMELA